MLHLSGGVNGGLAGIVCLSNRNKQLSQRGILEGHSGGQKCGTCHEDTMADTDDEEEIKER